MKKNNHYESAFAQYLHSREIPYLSTRETQRSFAGQEEYGSLKNIDFLVLNRSTCLNDPQVYPAGGREKNESAEKIDGCSWLIDIKGRRFPSGQAHPQYWRNWVSEDDLLSLSRWETIFGVGFQGLLVFAYDVLDQRSPIERSRLFEYQNHFYAFLGIPLKTYYRNCRTLSPKWRTVAMPGVQFRKSVIPLDELL